MFTRRSLFSETTQQTVATAPNSYWDGTGYAYTATIPSSTAGFWRATFTGGKYFENATSTVVYLAAS